MKLQPFDIILIKGRNDIISRIVKKATGSEYSHVALIIDSLHVIDIDFFHSIAIKHFDYKLNDFDCYRLHKQLTNNEIDIMTEYIQKKLNTKYDLFEALSYKIKWLKTYAKTDEPICLSFISDLFNTIKINIPLEFEQYKESTEIYKINN